MFRRNRPHRPATPPAQAVVDQECIQAHALLDRRKHAKAPSFFKSLTSLSAACAGAVLPTEMMWLNDNPAECACRGSPLRGE